MAQTICIQSIHRAADGIVIKAPEPKFAEWRPSPRSIRLLPSWLVRPRLYGLAVLAVSAFGLLPAFGLAGFWVVWTFVLLLAYFAYRFIRQERLSEERLEVLTDQPSTADWFPVSVEFLLEGFDAGRDFGVVCLSEGYLLFEGQRTSFAIDHECLQNPRSRQRFRRRNIFRGSWMLWKGGERTGAFRCQSVGSPAQTKRLRRALLEWREGPTLHGKNIVFPPAKAPLDAGCSARLLVFNRYGRSFRVGATCLALIVFAILAPAEYWLSKVKSQRVPGVAQIRQTFASNRKSLEAACRTVQNDHLYSLICRSNNPFESGFEAADFEKEISIDLSPLGPGKPTLTTISPGRVGFGVWNSSPWSSETRWTSVKIVWLRTEPKTLIRSSSDDHKDSFAETFLVKLDGSWYIEYRNDHKL